MQGGDQPLTTATAQQREACATDAEAHVPAEHDSAEEQVANVHDACVADEADKVGQA